MLRTGTRAAFLLLVALLLAGTATAIDPPDEIAQAIETACPPAAPLLAKAGLSCALLTHYARAPCELPLYGPGAACAIVQRPCIAARAVANLPGRPMGDASDVEATCAASGLAPLQTARFCPHAACASATTLNGGAAARWSFDRADCDADWCYATRFHANASANLRGAWLLEVGGEMRQEPGNQLVPNSRVIGACGWEGEGGCGELANGPSVRLSPSSADVRALAWHSLWWRDSVGAWHLQAKGSSCALIAAPGSAATC